jgi:two-component system, cell cycle response regulator DivK
MSRKILALVVDDFADDRELVAEYLTFKGFAVLTAATAAEAIQIARRVKPKIVLMDLCMPGVDGCDATRRLKGDPETSSIMVIAVTARAMTEDIQRAFRAGCDGVITKPFDLVTLAAALPRVLTRGATVRDVPGISLNPTSFARRRPHSAESLIVGSSITKQS